MLSEEIEPPEIKACLQCTALLNINSKFCNSCGAKQSFPEVKVTDQWNLLKQAAIFYALYLLLCCLSKFTDAFREMTWYLVLEVAGILLTVGFFAINWSENKALLKWPGFSLQKLSAYCGIAMAGAFLVHYAVGWLNVTIYSQEEHLFNASRGNYYAMFLLVFFTAVTPALFEELGFRGYLLQSLLKVSDTHQAVYISAFLFAIIHLSFISLFWLIPFALFIGYVRVRENTLWYGIFFHFCFNLTACLFELLQQHK
ncbi:MAG: CPBP family intramembrane glutamic endopeptidase [Bacteroidota bacterium]